MKLQTAVPASQTKGGNKVLNFLLSFILVLGLMPTLMLAGTQEAYADNTATQLTFTDGVATIESGGVYQLAADATGTVKVNTDEAVTIVGNLVRTEDGTVTSTPNSGIFLDFTGEAGVNVTLSGLHVKNDVEQLVSVAGEGNSVTFDGVSVFDFGQSYSEGTMPSLPVSKSDSTAELNVGNIDLAGFVSHSADGATSIVWVEATDGEGDGAGDANQGTEPETAISGDDIGEPWDGKVIDVSWYNTTDTSFSLSTPAQFMGLAAIVNGMVNSDITTVLDFDGEGKLTSYAIADYLASETAKVKASWFVDPSPYGGQVNGYRGTDTFKGKTIYLTADLDMGGVYDAETDTWSGARFMGIAGNYRLDSGKEAGSEGLTSEQMAQKEGQLNANFCGVLDGQGHWLNNVYFVSCSGNWDADMGIIGKLGVGDGEYADLDQKPMYAGVRNLVVGFGYIYGERSIGGIVGKVGKHGNVASEWTNNGTVFIENCANYASVSSTQKKGCGGIVGAGWNGVVIKNCYNAGKVSGSPSGGISGSNEAETVNCYNIGQVSGGAIADSNGGDSYENCYWLTGTASKGVSSATKDGVTEKTAEYMQSAEFLAAINGTGRAWVADDAENPVNGGYPILRVMKGPDTATVTEVTFEGAVKTAYVEGQKFSAASEDAEGNDTSFKVWAKYSDGTREIVEDYSVKVGDASDPIDPSAYAIALADNGKTLTIYGEVAGIEYSYTSEAITVAKNVPLEITSVSGAPQSMLFSVGQEIAGPSMVYLEFSNGDKGWIRPTDEAWDNLSVSLSGPLTAEDNGKVYSISYTLNEVTVSKEIGEITVVPEVKADESGVYEIYTAEDMMWLSAQVNDASRGANGIVSAKLMNDVDLSEVEWSPIGASNYPSYSGTFDGQGHAVTVAINSSNSNPQGLFKYVGASGVVKNLTVKGDVSAKGTNVGSVAAYLNGGLIENCVNEASVSSTYNNVGGIVGYATGSGKVANCVNKGAVSAGAGYAGGVVGYSKCVISGCSNYGVVNSDAAYAGGIAGYSRQTIADCANYASVTAFGMGAGGITGYFYQGYTISGCSNAGAVKGAYAVGGLVGDLRGNASTLISDCYNTGSVTSTSDDSAVGGGAAGLVGAYTAGKAGAVLSNCYSSGTVRAGAYVDASGAVTSSGNAALLVACDTKGATLTNCYYVGDEGLLAHQAAEGVSIEGDTVYAKTSEWLKTDEAVRLLNAGRADDATVWNADLEGEEAINNGLPVLAWQGGEAVATVLLGDVNGDGAVNQLDAGVLINYCLGRITLTDAQLVASDVNCDGAVNQLDAGVLINYCLGRISSFD